MPKTIASPSLPRKRYITDEDLAGIHITNATRRLFGTDGPTKLDLAVYYAQVGDYMLPHIIGRPVSLVRSPSGSDDRPVLPAASVQRHAEVAREL